MNTSVINVKIDQKVKKEAQKVAFELGLSLSAVINCLLRDFAKKKKITFSEASEEPSEHLKKALKEAEEDTRKGYVSPSFTNSRDAITWLKDPNARYENGKTK